ncbi:MAG: BON domain-containing protein [Spirochaetota bacterium]
MPLLEEDVKRDVVDQLAWDDRVDASQIGVTVDGTTVVLTGTVPTTLSRESATQDARVVPGVASVDNRLAVEALLPGPTTPSLEERATRVLEWDPEIDADRIVVTNRDGVLTVTGSVDALWKKFEVENRLLDVIGVMDVMNELTVVPTESVSDELIADDIRAAINRRVDVDIEDIDIEVANGVVTLSGTVPTWASRVAAMETARYTLGVTSVIDNLLVTVP